MRPTLFVSALVAACVVVSATPRPSLATSVHYRALRDLVRQSDVTLLGHATAQESFWQGTRIFTRVQVEVEEVWHGSAPSQRTIEVITPGGVVGDLGQRVDGAAVLPVNSQVVLHLRRLASEYVPVAMAQGVWAIAPDLAGRAPLGGRAVLRLTPDRVVYGLGVTPEAPPTTLAALKAAVLEAAHAP